MFASDLKNYTNKGLNNRTEINMNIKYEYKKMIMLKDLLHGLTCLTQINVIVLFKIFQSYMLPYCVMYYSVVLFNCIIS